jgi:hypothetical protein
VPTIFSIVHGRRPHAEAASPEGVAHV